MLPDDCCANSLCARRHKYNAGIITTIAGLAGAIIASYVRMSQKLGSSKDEQIEKLLKTATELQSTDHWAES